MLRWNLHAQHSIIRLKYGYYIVLGRQRYETFFIAQNFSENFFSEIFKCDWNKGYYWLSSCLVWEMCEALDAKRI